MATNSWEDRPKIQNFTISYFYPHFSDNSFVIFAVFDVAPLIIVPGNSIVKIFQKKIDVQNFFERLEDQNKLNSALIELKAKKSAIGG